VALTQNCLQGEDYPSDKAEAMIQSYEKEQQLWTVMPVYFYEGFNVYSIIEAQCPPTWAGKFAPLVKVGLGCLCTNHWIMLTFVRQKQVKKDIASFGYNTTIGLAQFHEQVLNRVPPEDLKVKRGRPRKETTGKRGRPSTAKTTRKAKEAAKAKNLGRKARKKHNSVDWAADEPMDDDIM